MALHAAAFSLPQGQGAAFHVGACGFRVEERVLGGPPPLTLIPSKTGHMNNSDWAKEQIFGSTNIL